MEIDMQERICVVPGCENKHEARGWCSAHYQRWRSRGSIDALLIRGNDDERFWSKVDKVPGGCWLWSDSTSAGGYGRFKVGGRTRPAHVWAYERYVGSIPEGHEIDHVRAKGCTNRHCVNFEDHLEAVLPRENLLRRGTTKMSDDDVMRAWKMRQSGTPHKEIAKEFGIDRSNLHARFRRLKAAL